MEEVEEEEVWSLNALRPVIQPQSRDTSGHHGGTSVRLNFKTRPILVKRAST